MATSASAIPLSDDERFVVIKALGLLSASMTRSAKAAPSKEIADLFERDSSRVQSLAAKFR